MAMKCGEWNHSTYRHVEMWKCMCQSTYCPRSVLFTHQDSKHLTITDWFLFFFSSHSLTMTIQTLPPVRITQAVQQRLSSKKFGFLSYMFTDWPEQSAFEKSHNSLNPEKKSLSSRTRASQQPSQRIRISIFQGGDRVICIYLMSIPPGSKMERKIDLWKQAGIVQKPFSATLLWQHWPLLQTKHCYIDNQEVWRLRHCGDVFFGKKRCTGDGISPAAKWVTWMVRKWCCQGFLFPDRLDNCW